MNHLRLFVLLAFVFGTIALVQSNCGVPSRFWCDDDQIASECGVLEQCNAMKRLTSDKRVDFSLYYESLCPGCRAMFQEQLTPAYHKIGSIMNIHLIPYGNAEERYDARKKLWIFDCQHGPQECVGNLIETCAIDMYKNVSAYFPFISCIEASDSGPKEAARHCARKHKVDIKSIMACATSAKGNALEHKMAQKTDALRPQHEYVPWVTVNGKHTEKIQDMAASDLVQLICDFYKGSHKPDACSAKTETMPWTTINKN